MRQGEVEHLLELRQVFGILVEDEAAWWGVFPEPAQAEIAALYSELMRYV